MISGAGLCWQHVGGVGSTTTTTAETGAQSREDVGDHYGGVRGVFPTIFLIVRHIDDVW